MRDLSFFSQLFQQDPHAERQYRSFRQMLVRYFAHKNLPDPENLADEVIKRVIAKMAKGENVESFERYCFGIARNVVYEERKRQRTLPLPDDDAEDDVEDDQTVSRRGHLGPLEGPGRQAVEDALFLSWLLKAVSEEERALLTEYYSLPEERENLAARRDISVRALRMKVHRIRETLRRRAEAAGLARAEAKPRPPRVRDKEGMAGIPPKRPSETTNEEEPEGVLFTAFHPVESMVDQRYSLVVYAHSESSKEAVRRDARKFFDELGDFAREATRRYKARIRRGTMIRIVPAVDGLEFSPKSMSLRWTGEVLRAPFRFRAMTERVGEPCVGEVAVYVGPIEVATIRIAIFISDNSVLGVVPTVRLSEKAAPVYANIFPSYSHKDSAVVLACKAALEAIGCIMLRDFEALCSGQNWSAAILKLIDTADVFQLFWSINASESEAVEAEWHYALSRVHQTGIEPAEGVSFYSACVLAPSTRHDPGGTVAHSFQVRSGTC
jgi:DNA-directed RNA polymerase specialized sigma24 family protein